MKSVGKQNGENYALTLLIGDTLALFLGILDKESREAYLKKFKEKIEMYEKDESFDPEFKRGMEPIFCSFREHLKTYEKNSP